MLSCFSKEWLSCKLSMKTSMYNYVNLNVQLNYLSMQRGSIESHTTVHQLENLAI